MKSVWALLLAWAFVLPVGPLRSLLRPRVNDVTRTVDVDVRARTYLVHIPRTRTRRDEDAALPVVLALHGGGSNAEQMVRFSGLDQKADAAGFIAVYPNGTGRLDRMLTWNAGNCCGYAERERVDDVAFIRALLDDLASYVRIDRARIYATGISNGGMMAHRLAAELSDRIAAVASVSGPVGIEKLRPRRAVSVMHFHGTADEFAPYDGGTGRKSLSSIQFRSVAQSIAGWVSADGCAPTPSVAALPSVAGDDTRVRRETYAPCANGAEVVLYVIEGGGHTWPGRRPGLQFLGKSTMSVSANDAMWDFFQKHPLH